MEDWAASLGGPDAEPLRAWLRALPLEAIRVIPPPRRGRIPFGHELAVLRRHLAGESCHWRPSGLSGLYQRRAGAEAALAFRFLVAGQPIARREAVSWVGEELLERLQRCGWAEPHEDGLRARLRLLAVADLWLLVDPIATRFRERVHLGNDSVKLVEFARRHAPAGSGRLLDVGTGSGVVLLGQARRGGFEEGLGIDINPRAVEVARFNARLNEVAGVEVALQDVFEAPQRLGRFDRVTWNTPFRFFPESFREENVDGFGGHLGTELTLRFLALLPELLTESGAALLLTAGPRMRDGSRPLDDAVAGLARRHALDVSLHVQGTFFDAELAAFHRGHGVEAFESVVLAIGHGSGRLERSEAPFGRRAADRVRGLLAR